MWRLVELEEMRKSLEQKSGYFLLGLHLIHGILKNQRPELWGNFNTRKKNDESMRVFPLSNWTELDIWQYIYQEKIELVPLYFASERKVVKRNGILVDLNDDRLKILPGEEVITKLK